jgi:GNAT superfamily N-acetyltransferase
MPKTTVTVATELKQSARVLQVSGMFDIPPSQRSELTWNVDLPIETRQWNVGLVVGPSGCGKSTVARNLWPEEFARAYSWPSDRSLLDAFPQSMGIKDITAILSSVGFSSPPAWLRPFPVLSNGEQFRVTMARALAEAAPGVPVVVDEFTSVVDRTVAQIGSYAIQRTVRARGQQFIAVSCHEDVEEWLQPDWVYRPATQQFQWRSVQRRPSIDLEIRRVNHTAWQLFFPHHYLTHELNKAAYCFVAFWRGIPVAFDSWLPFVGKLKGNTQGRRAHRVVCLPDYQGVGIGQVVNTHLASMWRALGYRSFLSTSHPGFIASRARDRNWVLTRAPGFTAKDTGRHAGMASSRASSRLTASFEYRGPAMDRAQAVALLGR